MNDTITPATRWGWERTVNELCAAADEYELDHHEHDEELVIAVHLPDRSIYLDPKTIKDWDADAYWAADARRLVGV